MRESKNERYLPARECFEAYCLTEILLRSRDRLDRLWLLLSIIEIAFARRLLFWGVTKAILENSIRLYALVMPTTLLAIIFFPIAIAVKSTEWPCGLLVFFIGRTISFAWVKSCRNSCIDRSVRIVTLSGTRKLFSKSGVHTTVTRHGLFLTAAKSV